MFGIDATERIELRRSWRGFPMPHGLDVHADGLLGVTNYVDNSLHVVRLPLASVTPGDSSRVAPAAV